MDFMRCFVVA